MVDHKTSARKDRLKDRSDIGNVEFPIEKLMEFRHAEVSCVQIEAAMEANYDVTHSARKKRKKGPDGP
ncbi:MAG: hypothetical protein VCD33_04665 [Alphaproteobacteria bacterium]